MTVLDIEVFDARDIYHDVKLTFVDSELILRQTADKLIDKLKDSENKLNIDGKSLNRLTFDQLSVYLSHVEDGIE